MSFGKLQNPPLSQFRRGTGYRDEFVTMLHPGGRLAAYVHHQGAARMDDNQNQITTPIVKTLNEALRQCRPGYNDVVCVLPGHAENISAADQMSGLVAGTRIIGLGAGNLRGTFTWTVAAASFLLDQANVRLENLRFLMDPGAGSVNVAAPMTISAAGCALVGCDIRMGTDANSTVTIGITTTAAADDLEIADCYIYGAAASAITTAIRLVGADRLRMHGTIINCGTSADGVGVVQYLTTASLDSLIEGCIFKNSRATSTSAFTGMAAATGIIRNSLACQGAAVGANNGFTTIATFSVGDGVYITSDDGTVSEIFPGA